MFAGGHVLLRGMPGLGRTLLVKTLAQVLGLEFRRIQFTPDLLPTDIVGAEVLEYHTATGQRQFRFCKGPVFTNLLLADELNRSPTRTQNTLLEVMQERQVTVGGVRRDLDAPFFVLATQNPIEQEGTYPLPEAQLDRFMFQINVGYPSQDEEKKILALTTSGYQPDLRPVLAQEVILGLQQLVRKVTITEQVVDFILRLVESFMVGMHKSRLRGISTEFSQHWPYVPGDGTRHLDWKLLARTDRLYLKHYEAETSMPVRFLLDTSQARVRRYGPVGGRQYVCQ